ncbi:Serine/threonine-protein kinase HAL4/SAT4 [Fulvia fulva]|uniref:non-specific serine/threonine protein kinase n=1 Tax=Passalora fulva TaxID=5499 RepID=A0A9Q8LHE0_PASFU|nr:Serine/threonine-protein kinase HAL4/SAT4 [Fulvia fulva]UJO17482.1 Serine/threonine-protein kinase HAL4/SAT4 [Fulvia fulva]WPV14710.1 Serine/threonine-protein kinase HAL4/SAT4 [Fulvia fulva]
MTAPAAAGLFVVRQWDNAGRLKLEMVIDADAETNDDEAGSADNNRRASVASPRFLAGDLDTLYKRHDSGFDDYYHHHSSTSEKDLIAALNAKQTRSPGKSRHLMKRRAAATSAGASSSTQSSSAQSSMSLEHPHHIHPVHNTYRLPLTMPDTPPEREKKPGFFKRLGHSRRKSQMPPPSQSQTPSPEQSRPGTADDRFTTAPSTAKPAAPLNVPRSVLRSPSSTNGHGRQQSVEDAPALQLNGHHDQFADADAEATFYPHGLTPLGSPKSTKGRVKWDPENSGDNLPTRPRRASSAATHGRRSSIYSKAADGEHHGGVNSGAGSKARRLSIHLPEEFIVDECPLEEFFTFIDRKLQKDIGEGGAATVKLMESKNAGVCTSKKKHVFAVKQFRPWEPEEEDEHDYEQKIKSEFAISKACQHPNIVETYRLCQSKDGQWHHVMQYCELGDLNDLINKEFFNQEDKDCMFKQLVRGVAYLHERGIAHRDLKSENLLVTGDGCLKIADFGTGEVFNGDHPGVRNCRRQSIISPDAPVRKSPPGWVGSKPYMAPEIIQRKGEYDARAADVWSVGICYITLCFGGTPWESADPSCKNFSIYMSTWDSWLDKYPDGEICKGRELPAFVYTRQFMQLGDVGTKTMVFGMLHPEPDKRWGIQDILEWKTVTEFACCQQTGYSDDIKKRQKKALHNHKPPTGKVKSPGKTPTRAKTGLLKPSHK